MLESVMFWNEPNNKSHWNFDELDPGWTRFSDMVRRAGIAVAAERPDLTRVLGGMSPIDPGFVELMGTSGVLDVVDAIAIHGFPLDWNNWRLDEWPDQVERITSMVDLPVWVSEVGVSTFGDDAVQVFGLDRTAELLVDRVPRIFWYSLFDLPQAWPATTRHREAEGSSYYRHFAMGLVREDGTPKPAFERFAQHTPQMGVCQWFHFDDHRLELGVRLLRELGVTHLRTGLSWADWFRPDAERWFDRMMDALDEFTVTATLCFTPEHLGMEPHHTSPPVDADGYAEFATEMVRRYATDSSRMPAR